MRLLVVDAANTPPSAHPDANVAGAPSNRLLIASVAAGFLLWVLPLLLLLLAWAFEGFSYKPGPDEIIIPRPPGWRTYLASWPWAPGLMVASAGLAFTRRIGAERHWSFNIGSRRCELGLEDVVAALGGIALLLGVLMTAPKETLLYFLTTRLAPLYPLGAIAFASLLSKAVDLLLEKDAASWPETKARAYALERLEAVGLLGEWAKDVRFERGKRRVVVLASRPDAANVAAATNAVQEALDQQGGDLKQIYPDIEVHHHSDTSRSEPPNSVSSRP